MRLLGTITSALIVVSITTISTPAQVVLDGTLGPSGSLAGPDVIVPSTAGTTVGGNLFHSFSQLDIPAGESVTFTGPGTVQNVLARVTSGTPSTINGRLRCDIADADLYLINPAGVVFGAGSSLEVRGSFAVTSADFIRLGDAGRFDAKIPAQSVLVSAPPSAFGFGSNAMPGTILARGNLGVEDGETVSVVGGDVRIAGGEILTASGVVNVVAAGAGADVSLSTPLEASAGGTVEIRDGAVVDVGGPSLGRVNIRGRTLAIRGATVNAVLTGDVPANDTTAIAVDVEEALTIEPGGALFSGTLGSASAGDVSLSAASIAIAGDGSTQFTGIGTQSAGPGAGGSIGIDADSLDMSDGSVLFARATSDGPGGSIRAVIAQTLRLTDDARIFAEASDAGNGGNVVLDVAALSLERRAGISSDTIASGAGGNITIDADTVRVADLAFISATTEGDGDAGDIQINVADSITLDGAGKRNFTGIGSNTQAVDLTGRGGSVLIVARAMQILDGAGVAAKTFAGVEGGNIDIRVDEQLLIRGQGLSNLTGVNAQAIATGSGGNLTVDAGRVVLDKGQLNADAQQGQGGRIVLRGDPLILSADSTVTASSSIGLNGSVLIQGQETDFITSLVRLPGSLATGAGLLPQCAIYVGNSSSFVATGRGGSPPTPGGWSASFSVSLQD